ncbi:hypothetical protein C0995_006574 [Termitomyces sp. Mi166|nr:hypothetical protein C0995_006574 [Termitomyces sp. Mi166\
MSASLEQPNAPVNGQHAPNPRLSLPRSNSIPSSSSWHKNASMVSLASQRTLQPSVAPAPLLRKRHSTYVLPTPPDRATTPVPVPGTSPIRPLRNQMRIAAPTSAPLSKKKSGSKSPPSTATAAREEITPWEFQPGPLNIEPSKASPVSDNSSPVSTRPQQSLATGLVSEVTPWEIYPVRRSATSRSSLTSKFIREVTPWELHPVPIVMPNRSTLATGPVEDVTPWELGPTPPLTKSSATINEKRSTRGSSSSNQDKSSSGGTQVRRRKSTSAKTPKPRFTFFGSPFYPGHPTRFPEGIKSPTRSVPKLAHTTSSRSPVPPLDPLPATNRHDTPTPPQQNLNFSTADRTIFEELKRNLEARDAQFVIKGEGSSLGSPLTCRGKKYHAFPPERVPYPRSYEREVIDLDVWETASCRDICESLTRHVFKTPPTKVLDLGCGTGIWILNCARAWKVQLSFRWFGYRSAAARPSPSWLVGPGLKNNMALKAFPSLMANLILCGHVKRIALGVPFDKWDGLFQEIIRVMKPGGAFEMLEEDLFFPGRLMDSSDSEPDIDSEKQSSVLSSHRESTQSYSDTNIESRAESDPFPFRLNGHSSSTPTTATFPATPSRSNSPVADIFVNEDMEKEAREILSQAIGVDYILPAEEPSSGRPSNDTLSPAIIRDHLQIKTSQSVFASSAVSLNPSAGSAVAPDRDANLEPKARTRSRAHSLSTFPSASVVDQRPLPVPETKVTTPPVPLLLRTIPKPPPNPRDHSLLEVIYIRLLESRSINMSPLVFLEDYVRFYFKDVRTFPPLKYHFPTISRKNRLFNHDREDNGEAAVEGLSSDDTDDARDAILPSPVSRTIRRKHSRRIPAQNRKKEDVSISEENRYAGVRGLVHHSTSSTMLDEPRAFALSPSIKGMSTNIASAIQRGSFLPDTTMHLDVENPNLHLALRAAEIVACSEPMWEWVQKFPAEVMARRERETTSRTTSRSYRSGSGSIEMPSRISTASVATSRSPDPFESSILDLTREDFDGLISRFEMDMRDKCDVKNALGERFSWYTSESILSQEREAFEKACEKWDKWEQEQPAATPSHERLHHQPLHPPSGAFVTTHHPPAAEGSRIQGMPVSMEQKKWVSDTSTVSSLATRRLSRSMRGFMAWKSCDIPCEDP